MNKVVFVKARFKPKYEHVDAGVQKNEQQRGLFVRRNKPAKEEVKQLQHVGWSDCEIDGVKLAEDLALKVDELNKVGYEVVSITPVTSGNYRYEYNTEGIASAYSLLTGSEKVFGGLNYSYGYGYSYTEGVLILARLLPEQR